MSSFFLKLMSSFFLKQEKSRCDGIPENPLEAQQCVSDGQTATGRSKEQVQDNCHVSLSVDNQGWKNGILIDKGKLLSAQKVSTGTSLGVQQVLRPEIDTLSFDSLAPAVMPSAEDLSFLLDCDDKQLSKDVRTERPPVKNQPADSTSRQCDFLGQSDFNVRSSSLQVIANTLPSACDLTTDLSVGENCSHAASVSSQESVARTSIIGTSSEQRSFPWKLHEMLSEVDTNGFQDIISWEPDGTAFKVHDCRLFVEKVMPLYFDQVSTCRRDFESFSRTPF